MGASARVSRRDEQDFGLEQGGVTVPIITGVL
jgi:hypothetical protein